MIPSGLSAGFQKQGKDMECHHGKKMPLLGPHVLPQRLCGRSHNEGISLHLTTLLLYADIGLSSGGQERLFLKVSGYAQEHKLKESGLYFLLIGTLSCYKF